MRLLLSCAECKRQYDATGRAVGSRFHCHCGHVITIVEPKGHDARVVRCSGCGGPREQNATACGFCGSDFTLHERDLRTVCPECLCRVSDRAKFCHCCGTNLTPELAFDAETQLVCPSCGDNHCLHSRRLGKESVTVLECDHCAGVWLGTEAFEQLTDRVAKDARVTTASVGPAPGGLGHDRQWQYRGCPICGTMMVRRNFGRKSGVIIDQCREHGTWFDADELPRILAWIQRGGLASVRRWEEEEAKASERQRRVHQAGRQVQARSMPLGDLNADADSSNEPLEVLLDVAVRIWLPFLPLTHRASAARFAQLAATSTEWGQESTNLP